MAFGVLLAGLFWFSFYLFLCILCLIFFVMHSGLRFHGMGLKNRDTRVTRARLRRVHIGGRENGGKL